MTLYIIRGLPGSGKSTLAHLLTPFVCEADQYFIMNDGSYQFDASKLRDAHGYCFARCHMFMADGREEIAISNTFSMRWEFAKYIELAQMHKYRIVEITLTGDTYGNEHNVPDETIQAMKDRWER